ncbi:MAG: hypothetical protein WA632_08210 [Gallionella sp.]
MMQFVNRARLYRVLLGSLSALLPALQAAADTTAEVSVNLARREDNLNWNIAGNSVNVLSELTWKKLAITQVSFDTLVNFPNRMRLSSQLGYGLINSGLNQDSDYDGNDRTQEFSRSSNKSGGNLVDASIGLGKTFEVWRSQGGIKVDLIPIAGLSIHQQNLTMKDGVQTISASSTSPPLGPIAGLNSSYKAQWMGPWWGLDTQWETARGLSLNVAIEYHLVDFSAKADWNLRTDFAHPVSYTHQAGGEGLVVGICALYAVNERWTMKLKMERQRWKAHAGTDVVFLRNGTTEYARLNEVNWDSSAASIGLTRRF